MKNCFPRMLLLLAVGPMLGCGGEGQGEGEDDSVLHAATPLSIDERAKNGELGALEPMHKDGIHAGLLWDGKKAPHMLFWMRPSEYRGKDLVDASKGPLGELRDKFEELVYGGFQFSGTLDESVRNRYKPDIARDNALIWDLGHPKAFAKTGKYRVEALTDADIARNGAAFSNAGHTLGLQYNLFCAGHAMLADGTWAVAGGHDKGGNNGIRKINLFDPHARAWKARPIPPVKKEYLRDPTGTIPPHPDPLDERNTDPPHPSDMKYQRWYPTVLTLPNGKLLILSGSDQDTSVGPDNASLTKVRQAVPEVYDPKTDTTVALENARKLLPMYVRSFVVQTGKGKHAWKVAVTAEVLPPLPEDLSDYDPFNYSGKTYYLDVLGALADPKIDKPAEKHWEFVDEARYAHDSGASVALWNLDEHGHPRSQRAVLFGGDSGTGPAVAAIESIDFADSSPDWKHKADLVRPASQNNAVALPDGRVVVFGGRASGVNTLEVQLYDPDTGKLRTVATSNVPRHDHSTAQLLPNGKVIVMGGNRVQLVPGNPDAGVPVAEIYSPPYLFKGERPVIKDAPKELEYGKKFIVRASPGCAPIDSVVIIRYEPVTHNWSWGNRYVKLSFKAKPGGKLEVRAPARPASAVPGFYMLFVVDKDGVPSVAEQVHLSVP